MRPVGAVLETLAPSRLGRSFRYLLASSWVSNLGDGISIAAGPLLVASQTADPILVAMAVLLQQLPWLVFGLFAGAISDRLDRRTIVVSVDLVRAAVLVLLSLSVVTDTVSVFLVLGAMFLLGTAEVFADNASGTLLPMLVARRDLAVGNARLQTGYITVNQLAGPPLGAALFAVGMAWPFVSQAVLIALGALLISRIALPPQPPPAPERHVRRDIAEGFRWVLHHPGVRTLILTIFTFNITYGAAWSVMVLYATERLELGPVGFGLLTTIMAVGGLGGTAVYGWITRRISLANVMRIGLILETFTHLALAFTTVAVVAMVIFFLFGAHAFIWATTSTTIRQRAVPTSLQGRVGSVYSIGVYAGLVGGAAVGGAIAQRWGVTAPFWFAFVGSAVFVVLIWRELRHIAHADDDDAAAETAPSTAVAVADSAAEVGR